MQMPPEPDDGELLAAYLAGDLDQAATAALEQRLAREPALQAQLDATHEVILALRSVDAVETPGGFEERLHARLAQEQAPALGHPPVADLDARRAARRRWTVVSSAAAGVVVLAVLGLGVLGGLGGTGADMAGEDQAMAPATDDAAPELEAATQAEGSGRSADEESGDADTAESTPLAPVVLDDQVPLDGEAAVQQRYAEVPEVLGLLGTPAAQAEELATRFQVAVQRAESFSDGTSPARCLDVVTTAAEGPLVPALVETVAFDGEPAIAYTVVGARAGSAVLDRVEVWIVQADTCATRLFATVVSS
jgi:hypothetical protein